MKKFSNNYIQYYKTIFTLDGNVINEFPDSLEESRRVKRNVEYDTLISITPKTQRRTKMMFEDLPNTYVRLKRGFDWDDILNSKGVKDLKYHWVKENHFMKDSLMQVSYRDIDLDRDRYAGFLVFGYDIFTFLSEVKKNSPECDLSDTRNKFIEHCEWLKENEPQYAPKLNIGETYGDWFDNKINGIVE